MFHLTFPIDQPTNLIKFKKELESRTRASLPDFRVLSIRVDFTPDKSMMHLEWTTRRKLKLKMPVEPLERKSSYGKHSRAIKKDRPRKTEILMRTQQKLQTDLNLNQSTHQSLIKVLLILKQIQGTETPLGLNLEVEKQKSEKGDQIIEVQMKGLQSIDLSKIESTQLQLMSPEWSRVVHEIRPGKLVFYFHIKA